MNLATVRVGDTFIVHRGVLGNLCGAVAVCVERYTLVERHTFNERPGIMLLFPNGQHDGFSPEDCDTFGVQPHGHCDALSDYQFKNVMQLMRDFHAGLFNDAVGHWWVGHWWAK